MTEHAAVIFVFFFLAEYASILLICILTSILFLGGYLLDLAALIDLLHYLTDLVYNLAYYLAYSLGSFLLYCADSFNIMYDSIASYYYYSADSWTEIYNRIDNWYVKTAPNWQVNVLERNNVSLYNKIDKIQEHIYVLNKISKEDIQYTDANLEGYLSYPLIEGMISGLVLGIKSCVMIFVFIWARASFPRIRYDQLMSFCWTILLPLVIAFIILLPCVLYNFDILSSNVFLL